MRGDGGRGGSRFHGQSDESSKTAQTKAAFVFVGGSCFTCILLSLPVAATAEEFAAAKLRRWAAIGVFAAAGVLFRFDNPGRLGWGRVTQYTDTSKSTWLH